MVKKAAAIVVTGTVCTVAYLAYMSSPNFSTTEFLGHPLEAEFAKFVVDHGRSFGTKAEYKFRRDIFAKRY